MILPFQPCVGQRRLANGFQLVYAFDYCPRTIAQLVGFTLHPRKGTAGLLPRHDVGNPKRIQRCFNQVCRLKTVGGHEDLSILIQWEKSACWRYSVFKSGKARTGSRPSQVAASLRMRSNSLPLGPATSESSITLPG